MNIVRLSDAQVRERLMETKDERQELWDICIDVTRRSFYTAGVYSITGGLRVLVTNMSGHAVIDQNLLLPQSSESAFTNAQRRSEIHRVKVDLRNLIRDEPKGAA